LTTATLDRLRELYPSGRFEIRQFRPNIEGDRGGRAALPIFREIMLHA
jgi:MOSC domain-containing protein